jgi:hypothetical protein
MSKLVKRVTTANLFGKPGNWMGATKPPRPYFWLIAFEGDHISDNPWGIAFGDYDKATVDAEREDYRDRGYKARELKVARAETDTQAAGDALVDALNAKHRGEA